jgi:hypothetical protein
VMPPSSAALAAFSASTAFLQTTEEILCQDTLSAHRIVVSMSEFGSMCGYQQHLSRPYATKDVFMLRKERITGSK